MSPEEELDRTAQRAAGLIFTKLDLERVQPPFLWDAALAEARTRLEAGGEVTAGYLADVYLNKVIEAVYAEEQE